MRVFRITSFVLGIVLLSALFPVHASASKKQSIRGGWVGATPCVITSYDPSPSDPTTGTFSCVGSTTWDGSWTGQTEFAVKGTINFLTGDASGTLEETLYGIATADQSTGSLQFTERFRVYGATNTLHIDLKIVGGTGDWVGSRGQLTFDGLQFLGVAGHGGYAGTWIRP
jgi:hypothetical protein